MALSLELRAEANPPPLVVVRVSPYRVKERVKIRNQKLVLIRLRSGSKSTKNLVTRRNIVNQAGILGRSPEVAKRGLLKESKASESLRPPTPSRVLLHRKIN